MYPYDKRCKWVKIPVISPEVAESVPEPVELVAVARRRVVR